MNKIKIFNKLVRDKIPEIIAANGSKAEIKILNDCEYLKFLNDKLLEECTEVIQANDKKSKIEELADVLEVIYSIADVFEIKIEEIEKIRINKKKERGGFNSKILLKNVIDN